MSPRVTYPLLLGKRLVWLLVPLALAGCGARTPLEVGEAGCAPSDRDADGDCFLVPEDCDDTDPGVHPGAFDAPHRSGWTLTTLELDVNDRPADTYRRPEMAQARAAAPAEIHIEPVGETGLELTWTASGGLYNVQLSTDRGRTWRTVAVGLTEPRTTIHPDNLPASGPVLFRVTATDGFTSTETTVEWSPER